MKTESGPTFDDKAVRGGGEGVHEAAGVLVAVNEVDGVGHDVTGGINGIFCTHVQSGPSTHDEEFNGDEYSTKIFSLPAQKYSLSRKILKIQVWRHPLASQPKFYNDRTDIHT